MKAIKTLPAFAAAVLVCGAFAQDQPQRVNLLTLVPMGSAAYKDLFEMGEKWRDTSKGQVTLNLFPNGRQGDERQIVKLMSTGNAQAALLSVAGLQIIDPAANALQSMPMVFRSFDELEYVREKLRPMLDKQMEAKGFVPLFWGDAGWVRFFSTKPVVHPDDLRKLKLFVLTGEVKQYDMMKAAGFQPFQYSYIDTVSGLAQGQIEAVPTIPMYALAGQFDRDAKYMLDINYVPLGGALVITAKAWNNIPPATRDAMRKAAEDAGKKIQAESRREMDAAVASMRARRPGLSVTPMTPALEAEWRQLFEAQYPRIRGGLVPAEMFDEVQRWLRDYRK